MAVKKSSHFLFRRTTFGFSIVELVVVMGIFALISGMILARHARFNSSVLLGSLAYDIALSIREAQVYGLSVKSYQSGFQVGYGLHFASPTAYTFFVDNNVPPNKQYDSATDPTLRLFTLKRDYTVSRFCGVTAAGTEHCSGGTITHLDIVFLRPNPDAFISSNIANNYSRGEITVSSSGGSSRVITVASTGQISVSGE